jgi:hypothetical protein
MTSDSIVEIYALYFLGVNSIVLLKLNYGHFKRWVLDLVPALLLNSSFRGGVLILDQF